MFDKLYIKIAWFLPKRLVYWCAIRLMSHATAIQPDKSVADLTVFEALEKWTH